MSLTTGTTIAEANSVNVAGSDVYTAGYESNGNGVATDLTDGTKDAKAPAIVVSQ